MGRTRTEYCRPARIHGDSVRLNAMGAVSSSVLSSMKTVPFCDGPLQYCAGCVAFDTWSGCVHARASVNSFSVVQGGLRSDVRRCPSGRARCSRRAPGPG